MEYIEDMQKVELDIKKAQLELLKLDAGYKKLKITWLKKDINADQTKCIEEPDCDMVG